MAEEPTNTLDTVSVLGLALSLVGTDYKVQLKLAKYTIEMLKIPRNNYNDLYCDKSLWQPLAQQWDIHVQSPLDTQYTYLVCVAVI